MMGLKSFDISSAFKTLLWFAWLIYDPKIGSDFAPSPVEKWPQRRCSRICPAPCVPHHCTVVFAWKCHLFCLCAYMDNAAYIIFIMWNSISGLDAWYHFWFNITCGVAVMGRSHQKNSDIFLRGGEGGKKHFGGKGQFLRSSSFLGHLHFWWRLHFWWCVNFWGCLHFF